MLLSTLALRTTNKNENKSVSHFIQYDHYDIENSQPPPRQQTNSKILLQVNLNLPNSDVIELIGSDLELPAERQDSPVLQSCLRWC